MLSVGMVYLTRAARFHAEQETKNIHPPDEQFIGGQNDGHGQRGEQEKLCSDTSVPSNYIGTDQKDDRMVEDVEWQNCFVGIGKDFIVEVKQSGPCSEQADYPAPAHKPPEAGRAERKKDRITLSRNTASAWGKRKVKHKS